MTGIERLRKLIEDYREGRECDGFECTALSCGKCMAKNVLEPIADQIEREHAEDCFKMGERAAEDAEAVAWVREHGGLDEVRRRWEYLSYYADPVPRSCMEKRLARLQRQIDESHAALRRRNARIGFLVSELNRANHENHEEFIRRAGDYTAFTDEVCKRLAPELRYVEGCSKDVMDAALDALDRRLMPEGTEWPRYESGDMVQIDDDVVERFIDDPIKVRSIEFRDGYTFLRECYKTDRIILVHPGERVKRPAPKVLDADGEGIRVGDTVYSTRDTESGTVVYAYPPGDHGQPSVKVGAFWHHASELTHRAPVLAADGRPLRVGETVFNERGDKFTVSKVEHERGVFSATAAFDGREGIDFSPVYFSHEHTEHKRRPEIDSWERLEEDANKNPFDYCKDVGHRLDTCENSEAYKARDLVRRARALVERDE